MGVAGEWKVEFRALGLVAAVFGRVLLAKWPRARLPACRRDVGVETEEQRRVRGGESDSVLGRVPQNNKKTQS